MELLNPDDTCNRTLLQQYFYPPDIECILQIKTSSRLEADFLAWYPGKHGQFSVRSAYYLGLDEKMLAQDDGASSTRPDGRRLVWDLVWKNGAPAKVCIFAWKAAQEALATQAAQKHQHLILDDTCTLCGQSKEDVPHALICCPHAVALWQAMRENSELPTPDDLRDAEPEWVFRLLEELPHVQRLASLMIMWRIWYAWNEITHNKPPVQIEGSRRFLSSYITSLLAIEQHPGADLVKGK